MDTLRVLATAVLSHPVIAALAILLLGFVLAVAALFRRPKNLSHIPQLPLHKQLLSALRGDDFAKAYRFALANTAAPTKNNSSTHGVHTEFSLGEHVIFVTRPDYIREILAHPYTFDKFNPGQAVPNTILGRFFGDSNIVFGSTSDGTWARHRRIFGQVFKRPSSGWDTQIFAGCAQNAFRAIEQETGNGRVVEAAPLCESLAMDAFGALLFGKQMTKGVAGGGAETAQLFTSLYKDIKIAALNPLWLLLSFLDKEWNPFRVAAHRKLHQLDEVFLALITDRAASNASATQSIGKSSYVAEPAGEDSGYSDSGSDTECANDSHASSSTGSKDLLSILLDASGNESEDHHLSTMELRNNIVTIGFAAHDTTSALLSSALFVLGKYPHIQQLARDEVLNVLGDFKGDVVLTPEQQRNLPYLTCVLKEVLRVYPSVSYGVFRRCREDFFLGKERLFVPKGSLLGLHYWGAHYDATQWPNVHEFDASRFENDISVDSIVSKSSSAWMPFSGGIRSCIGATFAYAEARTVLAMFLHKYEWTLAPNHPGELLMEPLAVLRAITNPISFKPRY